MDTTKKFCHGQLVSANFCFYGFIYEYLYFFEFNRFLLISLGFIFSAAAVGQSRIDLLHLNERNIIRDDSIVFIKKLDNGTHEFIPKEIKLPKHLDKILENFE